MSIQQTTQLGQRIRINSLPDMEAVIQEVSTNILKIATTSIKERNRFSFVLTGGRTAKRLYTTIQHSVDNFDGWEFWFGDERNLPEEHSDRNSLMAIQSLFCGHPPKQFHQIPYNQNNTAAAANYQSQIEENKVIPFDLVLLSLGEDGHIASLFPGRTYDTGSLVISLDDAPKDPPSRISLTASTLSNCRNMIVLATGKSKADTLARWLIGEKLPVTSLNPDNGIDLFTDQHIQV